MASTPIKELGEGYLAAEGTTFHDITEQVSRCLLYTSPSPRDS